MKKLVVLCAALATSAAGVACSGDDTVGAAPDGGASFKDGGATIDTTAGGDAGPDATSTNDAASDAPNDVAHDAKPDASAADCLASSGSSAFFTISDASKCVVAVYTVPTPSLSSLTWGRHGGPLGFSAGATLDIVRYAVPNAATGALTPTNTPVTVSNVPNGAFWGSQALDFPFFPTLKWTAIAYTGSGAGFPGEIILVNDTGAVQTRYNVNGFFAETAVATNGGRLLYTGLSPLMSTPASTNMGGLYAADTCGTAASNPRLLPNGDATCMAPFKVSTWQAGSSGPVAVDASGNVFAILSTFGGNQELRGFEHDTVARGAAAVAGTPLFSMTGYTTELAADGKAAYFQSNDPNTYTPLDVQRVTYTVDANAKTITGGGAPATFLTMAKAGTAVALLVDDQSRLWVGVTNPGVGDAAATTSTFFVIRDKNP